VLIIYDLTGGQPEETLNIEVTVSDNNGQSFLIIPKSLSGDLKDVTSGYNKKIIWDVLNDNKELTGEGFVFKLDAKSNNPASNFSANSGTFTDERDGVVYKWVKIGTHIWMAENLKATKYNDGSTIPNVTEKSGWKELKTGACSWYKNDIVNKTIYGTLYNWYAVNTGKLCPEGWRLPTDDQWTALTTYLGGEGVAGGKLKETGTIHWFSPNTGATNTSGFLGLPGGARNETGEFNFIGGFGFWWSSTEDKDFGAWYYNIVCNNGSVNRSINFKEYGYSVRCMRNN
jgi:uncharacterized protein (TIGR02145 family)